VKPCLPTVSAAPLVIIDRVSTIERPLPPLNVDERTTLESWLDFHRAALAIKCEGLDDEQAAAASVPPSGASGQRRARVRRGSGTIAAPAAVRNVQPAPPARSRACPAARGADGSWTPSPGRTPQNSSSKPERTGETCGGYSGYSEDTQKWT
jgi:hypothetical protein